MQISLTSVNIFLRCKVLQPNQFPSFFNGRFSNVSSLLLTRSWQAVEACKVTVEVFSVYDTHFEPLTSLSEKHLFIKTYLTFSRCVRVGTVS